MHALQLGVLSNPESQGAKMSQLGVPDVTLAASESFQAYCSGYNISITHVLCTLNPLS